MGFTTSQMAAYWESVRGRYVHVSPVTILSVFVAGDPPTRHAEFSESARRRARDICQRRRGLPGCSRISLSFHSFIIHVCVSR